MLPTVLKGSMLRNVRKSNAYQTSNDADTRTSAIIFEKNGYLWVQESAQLLVIPRYAVTACETDH